MNPFRPAFRKYGSSPYNLVLVHGGPGAAGYLAPVAKRLSSCTGIIEAFQTEDHIDGLIHELYDLLKRYSHHPVLLFGHSWGAWLSLMFAARYPGMVRKLILAASAPLEEKYVPQIMETRMDRLGPEEKKKLSEFVELLESVESGERDLLFGKISRILEKADTYEAREPEESRVRLDYSQYLLVWREAENLRRSGELPRIAARVRCPVLVIHGDYDPHPADGVRLPLEKAVGDLNFTLLEKCGHEPWKEMHASERFYEMMEEEIGILFHRDGSPR
jgi:pimeloyl-ACP methyl ester carboxylesterase